MPPSRVWLTTLLVWLSPLVAAGQAAPDPGPPAYEEAIKHAVEEYSLGNWAEAKFFFGRAHELNPSARTFRGLGLTCYESRSYVEAIDHFEAALANKKQPLTAPMRADVSQLLEHARQFVTRVVVELTPKAALLEVDHKPHPLDAAALVWLDPGDHEVVVRADGYQTERRTLTAEGGELQLRVALSSSTVVAAEPAPLPSPPMAAASVHAEAPPASARDGALPWVIIGSSGALAIAGAVLVAVAASDKASVEAPPANARWPELEGRYDRARTFFPLGFALAGLGLAGVATGLTWKLWPERREQPSRLQLGAAGLGLALSGTM